MMHLMSGMRKFRAETQAGEIFAQQRPATLARLTNESDRIVFE
jgi:hypothetical protein